MLQRLPIAGTGHQPADPSLMMVPSVPKIQEGKPLEEIQLARDEVANMVWGIETRVPLPSDESIPGGEAVRDTLRHQKRSSARPQKEALQSRRQPTCGTGS
jgi:hypothetical protein